MRPIAQPPAGSYRLKTMRAMVVLACCGLLLGCVPDPTGEGGVPSHALYVGNRGGPTIVIKAGADELARVVCGGSAVVSLDDPGVPPLPWSLSVAKASDGTVLLATTVTDLPRFVDLEGEVATISSSTNDAMSPGPSCTSGP